MLLSSTTLNGAVSNDSNNNITMSVGNTVIANVNSSGIYFESGKKAIYTGAVLQVVSTQVVGGFVTSSSSYVFATNQSISITSTVANSKFLVLNFTPIQLGDADVIATSSIRSSVDSYASNLTESLHVNYSPANDGWKMASPVTVLHSPSQPASTTITYRTYVKRNSGTDGVYYPDAWGQSFSFGFYVMEIAP